MSWRSAGFAGEDLGAWLVGNGLALAQRRYSTAYVPHEGRARLAKAGMWQGAFVPPWDWRRGERLEATAIEPSDCPIKGNVSSKGERIYHVPGGRYYDRTRIDLSKGERWFCFRGGGPGPGRRLAAVTAMTEGIDNWRAAVAHRGAKASAGTTLYGLEAASRAMSCRAEACYAYFLRLVMKPNPKEANDEDGEGGWFGH